VIGGFATREVERHVDAALRVDERCIDVGVQRYALHARAGSAGFTGRLLRPGGALGSGGTALVPTDRCFAPPAVRISRADDAQLPAVVVDAAVNDVAASAESVEHRSRFPSAWVSPRVFMY
jgi:hypothetical protein